MEKGGKRDSLWYSYAVEVYRKGDKDQDGYFVYSFIERRMIDRCQATTQKGTQCMREAAINLTFCKNHKSSILNG
jgi:hypothetical protein